MPAHPKEPSAPRRPEPTAQIVVRPCAAGTRDHEAASEALAKLDAQIRALRVDGDPGPATRALEELLAGPCFELASWESPLRRVAPSAWALRDFWRFGGRKWVAQYLDFFVPELGARYAWTPPTVRVTLTAAARPDHPLLPDLCPPNDDKCAAPTSGWAMRADRAFQLFARSQQLAAITRSSSEPVMALDRCDEVAEEDAPLERWTRWRECLERAPDVDLRQTALPLGAMRPPSRGWWVVRGRRGHYDFCDELRLFDLATGAMYVDASCSELVLRPGGSVDGEAMRRARKHVRAVGRVDVMALREAMWASLMSLEVQRDVRLGGAAVPIPPWIEPVRSGLLLGSIQSVNTSSSGHTPLWWDLVRDGRALSHGELTYPDHLDDAARDHAMRLLRIAEATLIEGCVPAHPAGAEPFPRLAPGDPSDDVDDLREALKEIEPLVRAAPRCAAGARTAR